jgi:hypothetical protein
VPERIQQINSIGHQASRRRRKSVRSEPYFAGRNSLL